MNKHRMNVKQQTGEIRWKSRLEPFLMRKGNRVAKAAIEFEEDSLASLGCDIPTSVMSKESLFKFIAAFATRLLSHQKVLPWFHLISPFAVSRHAMFVHARCVALSLLLMLVLPDWMVTYRVSFFTSTWTAFVSVTGVLNVTTLRLLLLLYAQDC